MADDRRDYGVLLETIKTMQYTLLEGQRHLREDLLDYIDKQFTSINDRMTASHRERREEADKIWRSLNQHSSRNEQSDHAILDRRIAENEQAIRGAKIIYGTIVAILGASWLVLTFWKEEIKRWLVG